MINIPCVSETAAEAFSVGIANLAMPLSVRLENYDTLYYCGWEQHPTTGVWYLRFPEEYELYIHYAADEHEFDTLIQYLIDTNQAPSSTLTEVQGYIVDVRGTIINVVDLIPQFWLDFNIPDEEFIIPEE